MRRNKSFQIKRSMLHAVKWKARSDLVAERKGEVMVERKAANLILRNLSPEDLNNKFKEECTDYIKDILTTKDSNAQNKQKRILSLDSI